MGRALSRDLRDRVVAAVGGGLSCRAAAERFGVRAASAIRWRQLALQHGTPTAKPQDGDRRSAKIEDHASLIHAAIERQADITLEELRTTLARHGVSTSIATLWRFFARQRITRKKDGPCQRAGPARHVERRWVWFEGQVNLDPERLVFTEESWASTNMARRHGRC